MGDQRRSRRATRPPRAFTLVELLIVVALIGLVVSLALPAVMDARAAAHRTACANNLRQIGVGLHRFEADHGRFPGSYWGTTGRPGSPGRAQWSFSPSSLIAPDLGGPTLADRVPTQQPVDAYDPDWSGIDLPALAVLHCPADGMATGRSSSYRYCRGNLPRWPKDPGGVFVDNRGMSASRITDGLTYTAFASERLVSVPVAARPDRRRDLVVMSAEATPDIASACVAANEAGTVGSAAASWSIAPTGSSWASGLWLHNAYYHLYPPNSAWTDCRKSDVLAMAVLTARSNHGGGVHLLSGDGHVRYATNSIATDVWRAWATRAGGETRIGD